MMHNLSESDTQVLAYLPLNTDMFCLRDSTVLIFYGHLILILCAAEKV